LKSGNPNPETKVRIRFSPGLERSQAKKKNELRPSTVLKELFKLLEEEHGEEL